MPYDSVAYPRIAELQSGQPSGPAQLETMWLSGLLDHVDQSAVQLMGKKVGPFLALPGPGILPMAREELKKLEKKREKLILERADYSPRFEDMPLSARRRKGRTTLAEEGLLDDDPRFALDGGGGGGSEATEGHAHKALTQDEVMDLKRIARSLEPLVVRTNYERNMEVYKTENRKLRRVLRGEVVVPTKPAVASEEISAVFEVTRLEHVKAIVIQRFWKRQAVRKFWRLRVYQILQVTKIQAMVRGVIARRLVAVWYRERLQLAIQWQARIRGALRIRRFRRKLAREQAATPYLQKAVRGFLARRRFVYLRRTAAALPIQRLWRGCRGRFEADRRWLAPRATAIQTRARGVLARLRLARVSDERGALAAKIQRCFRGHFARQVRNVRLFDRETVFREALVAELAAEASWHFEVWHGRSRAFKRSNFEAREARLVEALAEEERQVHALETNYVELVRQRRQLSPRGIDQGWREELNKDIKAHRADITATKLQCLFGSFMRLRGLREQRDAALAGVREARADTDQFNDWREAEVVEGIEREARYKRERKHESEKRRVAHERRRWQVHFHTPSGKPDKWRKPGRPWDPRALAGPERATFSGGTSDVFAFNRSVEQMRLGSDESLQRVMSQVQTQNFLNEVQSMDALLAPLARPLREMQHETPLWEEKQRAAAPAPAEHPWVPNNDELGVPYVATGPPPNPLRPPKPPSYPSPRGLEARDDAEAAARRARAAAVEEAAEAEEVAHRQQAVPHHRPTEADRAAGYDSRMAVYGHHERDDAYHSLLEGGGRTNDLESLAKQRERREERQATEARRAEAARVVRDKKARRFRPVVSRIPWTLLDELEAAKYKLKAEKAMAMLKDP